MTRARGTATAPHGHLTPSEALLIDVLAARRRLGEHIYLVSTEHSRTLNSLESKGLIWTDSGNVERTRKASLTPLGIAVGISEGYTPPVLSPECRSFYIGPKSVVGRVDCERRNHHGGKHRWTLTVEMLGRSRHLKVVWTTEEQDGLDDPRYAAAIRADVEKAERDLTQARAAVREGRVDWATGTITPPEVTTSAP